MFKQAVTPTKLHGGVEGLTSTNALAGGEGSAREDAFGRQIGDFAGIVHESWWDLPLSLEVWVGWGSPHWHPHQITIYYKSSESHHLFSKPIFMPVTLSPRYFGVPLYHGLLY